MVSLNRNFVTESGKNFSLIYHFHYKKLIDYGIYMPQNCQKLRNQITHIIYVTGGGPGKKIKKTIKTITDIKRQERLTYPSFFFSLNKLIRTNADRIIVRIAKLSDMNESNDMKHMRLKCDGHEEKSGTHEEV